MTKLQHNQTFKIAVIIAAVIAVFMVNSSVNGGNVSPDSFTSLSELQVNASSFNDTTGIVCPEDITTYTDEGTCQSFISSGLKSIIVDARKSST